MHSNISNSTHAKTIQMNRLVLQLGLLNAEIHKISPSTIAFIKVKMVEYIKVLKDIKCKNDDGIYRDITVN